MTLSSSAQHIPSSAHQPHLFLHHTIACGCCEIFYRIFLSVMKPVYFSFKNYSPETWISSSLYLRWPALLINVRKWQKA
jgi:hypothetical protein